MNDGNRNNTYNIYLGDGGNFNQNIQGSYLQVHGNYINISQDLSQAAAQIQELLRQLENQGYSSHDAQQKVAKDWEEAVKKNPKIKDTLLNLGQSVRDAATNAVVGEAALEVIKLVLRSFGVPI